MSWLRSVPGEFYKAPVMADIARTVATKLEGERHHERSRNEPFGCHHGRAGRARYRLLSAPRGTRRHLGRGDLGCGYRQCDRNP